MMSVDKKPLSPSRACAKVEDVGEVDCVATANQVADEEAGGPQDHDDPVEVRLVHEREDAVLEASESVPRQTSLPRLACGDFLTLSAVIAFH